MPGGVRVIGGLLAGALVTCATAAFAEQDRDRERPFRPLYSDQDDSLPRRLLTFDMAVHEALGQAAEGLVDGYSTNARVNGGFTARGRRLTFNIGGGTEYRYHTASREIADQGRYGAIGLEARGRTTRFTIGQTVRHLPFQQLVGLPSVLGPDSVADTSADHALDGVSNTVYGSSVAFQRTLGRDGTLVFDYGLGMTRTGAEASQNVHRGGAMFTERIGRNLQLQLGYHARSRQPGRDATLVPMLSHDVDAGLAFTRGLSLTRRTNVTFTSGSSIVSSDLGRQYVLTGSAALNHMIGRTWNASVTFNRGLDFPDALPQPVISDQVSLALGGYWGRRFSVRARATGGIGNLALEQEGQYRTFGTEVRASLILKRRWQWFAEHFYFQHEASGGAIAAGLPAASYRRGIRTGLDMQLAFLDPRRK